MMNIEEAMDYLKKVSSLGSKPGLSRIRLLSEKLGNPEKDLKIVHVAGTNGKGSFSAMLESVMRRAGFSTGLFTSPHMIKYNERIKFNGEDIDDGTISVYLTEIARIAADMRDRPTEFEITTALGYLYFRDVKPDICIVECGMGGRYDATNIIETPVLSVITGVSLDHTAYLGDTVEKIALEKAGIIKPGVPVLYGGDEGVAQNVIAGAAEAAGSRLYTTGRNKISRVRCETGGTAFDYGRYRDVRLGLCGCYQAFNASNVIAAVKILRKRGYKIGSTHLREGLKSAKWFGRFEKIAENPPVFFDGGHNPEGVELSVETARLCFDKKPIVVSGVLCDKDYRKIAGLISGCASEVFTASPDSGRALGAPEYASCFADCGIASRPCSSFAEALTYAAVRAKEEGRAILVLGSLYSYADVKSYFEENENAEKQD